MYKSCIRQTLSRHPSSSRVKGSADLSRVITITSTLTTLQTHITPFLVTVIDMCVFISSKVQRGVIDRARGVHIDI